MFRRSVLAAVGLTSFASILNAQTPAPASPPAASEASAQEKMEDPQVGDYWTYDYHDEIAGDIKSIITNTVTDLSDSQISIRLTWAGKSHTGTQTFDRSWNMINSGGVNRYSPNDGSGIRAPLAIGKTWSSRSNEINSSSGLSVKRTTTSKVSAQESVTTQAGTFDTFKIETSIQVQNANNAMNKVQVVVQTWYAPKIDHWVKRNVITRSEGRVRSNSTVELVDYGRR